MKLFLCFSAHSLRLRFIGKMPLNTLTSLMTCSRKKAIKIHFGMCTSKLLWCSIKSSLCFSLTIAKWLVKWCFAILCLRDYRATGWPPQSKEYFLCITKFDNSHFSNTPDIVGKTPQAVHYKRVCTICENHTSENELWGSAQFVSKRIQSKWLHSPRSIFIGLYAKSSPKYFWWAQHRIKETWRWILSWLGFCVIVLRCISSTQEKMLKNNALF